VLFTRTADLVQRLQVARRELALEGTIAKLDKFHLLILDDLAYVTKDQAETSVLFELISARYERRSLLITANQPFGEWGKIFPDQAMTVAVVDRLVHHATIFEMNVESYRRRAALERKRGRGRPPTYPTIARFLSRLPRYKKPAKAEPVLALLLEFPLRFRGLRAGELEEVRRRDKAAPFREPAPLGTEIDHRCALGPRRREAPAQLNQLHPMLPGAEKRARALSAKCRREVRD
jgi:hypothetical protein